MNIKEINLYEVNEFNKQLKEKLDIETNKNNELENENKELENLELEIGGLMNAELTLEGEQAEENRSKQEELQNKLTEKKEKISSLKNEKQIVEDEVLKLRLEKENAKRELNLREAKVEKKIANLQKKWNVAAQALNDNTVKMRSIDKETDEYKQLVAENKKHRAAMKRNVITSKTGMKLTKELDDIKAMKNMLESGAILEGLTKPENSEATKQVKVSKTKKTKEPAEKITEISENNEVEIPEEKITETQENKEDKISEEKSTEVSESKENETKQKEKVEKTKEKPVTNVVTKTVETPKEKPATKVVTKTVVTPKAKPVTKVVTKEVVIPQPKPVTKVEQKPVEKPQEKPIKKLYSEMTIEELEKKQRELFARIVAGDDYYWRAHHENGMEGYEEDDLDVELNAIREEIAKRKEKEEAIDIPTSVEENKKPKKERRNFFKWVKDGFGKIIDKVKGIGRKKLPAPKEDNMKTVKGDNEFRQAIKAYVNEDKALKTVEDKSKSNSKVNTKITEAKEP